MGLTNERITYTLACDFPDCSRQDVGGCDESHADNGWVRCAVHKGVHPEAGYAEVQRDFWLCPKHAKAFFRPETPEKLDLGCC